MFLIHALTGCKWPICMKEISIFDLSVFWMKSLSTEVMEIILIVIDATPWLPNNNRWYAAHIVTFTCCSPRRLVSVAAGPIGILSRHLHTWSVGARGWSVCRVPSQLWPKERRRSLVTSSQSRFASSPSPSSFFGQVTLAQKKPGRLNPEP